MRADSESLFVRYPKVRRKAGLRFVLDPGGRIRTGILLMDSEFLYHLRYPGVVRRCVATAHRTCKMAEADLGRLALVADRPRCGRRIGLRRRTRRLRVRSGRGWERRLRGCWREGRLGRGRRQCRLWCDRHRFAVTERAD